MTCDSDDVMYLQHNILLRYIVITLSFPFKMGSIKSELSSNPDIQIIV